MPVRKTIPEKDGVYFITFTCARWLPPAVAGVGDVLVLASPPTLSFVVKHLAFLSA